MDPDEIEPAASGESAGRNNSGVVGGHVPAIPPEGCAPASSTDGRGLRGASNSLIAIAAAVINSSMATTHPAAVAMIITVAVLAVALALD